MKKRKQTPLWTAAIVAIVAAVVALFALDPRSRPAIENAGIPLGPVWTEPNQPRPTPGYFTEAAEAGRRRSWLRMLKSFGETELTAPPGWSSYRVLITHSLAYFAYSARLDVRPDGSGRLSVGRKGVMDTSGPALRTAQVDIPAAEVAVVTRALAASPFEHISADGDLSHRHECADGGTDFFEAYVNQRYRYVMRGCARDAAVVRSIATPLADLAIRQFPDWLLVPA